MATFTNWNWNGDDKYQALSACSDANPDDGTTWAHIAEVRRDGDGRWWSFAYLPDFWVVHDVYSAVSYWMPNEGDVCKTAIEAYLHEQGVI
jgi:hypothetical protein